MATKVRVKIMIDAVMTLLLFAVMAYPMTGEALHKWLGICMFALFLLHNILNWKWYRSIPKGKYTQFRWLHFILNALLFLSMIGLVASSFLLSSWAYSLNIHAGQFSRKLHMLSASWGYILMSAHIGLHWGMFIGMIRKKVKVKLPCIVCYLFSVLMVIYGIYEAVVRQFFLKMFWMLDYAFYDFNESAGVFFIDYLFILCAFLSVSYFTVKLFRHHSDRQTTKLDSIDDDCLNIKNN